MKQLIKSVLQAIGRVKGLRELWLALARWILQTLPLPTAARETIIWQMGTYVLGLDYRAEVHLNTGPHFDVGLEEHLSRLVLFYPKWKDYLWEPQSLRLALRLQNPSGATFIAGAHIGYHALHLADAMKARGGRVFAFEPVSELYQCLARNKALSRLDNLIIEHAVLSASGQEEMILNVAGSRSSAESFSVGEALKQERVRAVSLEAYAREQGVSRADLIFLDIEGSEFSVLRGAAALLEGTPNLILEVNRPGLRLLGLTEVDFYRFLFERGYGVYAIDDDYHAAYHHVNPHLIRLLGIALDDSPYCAGEKAFNILATRTPGRLNEPGIEIHQGTKSS